MTDRTARTVTRPTSRDLVRMADCLLGARNLLSGWDWAGASRDDYADIRAGQAHLADLAEALGSVAADEAVSRRSGSAASARLEAIYETTYLRGDDL